MSLSRSNRDTSQDVLFARVHLEPSGGHKLEIATYEGRPIYYSHAQVSAMMEAAEKFLSISIADDGGQKPGHDRLHRKIIPLHLETARKAR